MTPLDIESCCNEATSAAQAKSAGAVRIELCQDLAHDGLTPSKQDITMCVQQLHLQTYVLIRPRSGDFVYNAEEIATIEHDIMLCKSIGVSGIVVGFLKTDRSVDAVLTRHIVQLAKPMSVTFHRAFDCCNHWASALETIIDCGCDRLLTSGCRNTAWEGRDTLRELVQVAQDRICIMAGSGITAANARQVAEYTNVKALHASCKVTLPDGCIRTSADEVRSLFKALHIT